MVSFTPARSRRIIFSPSASALPRRRCVSSSSVSSPMAKYASCWRAHGPQKGTPRISTSARRGQGLCVLMCTWQGPGFVIASVKEPSVPQLLDSLLEGVARAEGWDLLGCDLHLLTGLGVPALPGLTLPNGELPEACDLDLLASLERFGHYLLEGLEVLLGLALGHPSFLGDPLDEFLLFHVRSFLWSSWAPWRACLVCLLPLYKGAGTPCHPLAPSGFGETEVVGVYSRRSTTFGTSTSQRRLGRIIHAPKHCCSRCSMLTGSNHSAAPKEGVAAESNNAGQR